MNSTCSSSILTVDFERFYLLNFESKTEVYLGPCETSMMRLFEKIENDF